MRRKAVALRKRGRSLNEIVNQLAVSKSSVSAWVRDVTLSDVARKRIESRYTMGQLASQKAHFAKTASKEVAASEEALRVLETIPNNSAIKKLLCAVMYWCEGAKLYNQRGNFSFTNSDPALVRKFLALLRESYELDESKFRACVHLHSYHSESAQLKFWSKMTSIPIRQFIRSYHKQESGKSIRTGYQGCISVRYYDAILLRQLLAIAREFLNKKGL